MDEAEHERIAREFLEAHRKESLQWWLDLIPTVAEVQEKLMELGPRGQFMARSDIEDVLDVVRKIMEER